MATLEDLDLHPVPEKSSPMKIGIRYGIILFAAGLIIQLITYFTLGTGSGSENPELTFLLGTISLALTIAIIVMAVRHYRDKGLGGFISLRQGLGVCFWMGMAYGLFTTVWVWVFNNVIAPDAEDPAKREIDRIRAQVEDGEVDASVLQIVEWTYEASNNPTFIFIGGVLSILFFGFFVSLFTKRTRPQV